ncbi:MAG: ZIP family metal transporter [Candidatus Kerfeldbacteria bacterium]|nr:ZIP family metal transporter [Candidatus Kerfeldbacteria bacterium]
MSILFILLVTTAVSLIGLSGGLFLLWKSEATKRWAPFLLSFAAGSILGAAFLDLLPEAIEHAAISTGTFGALVGIITFFTIEKLLVWHHHAHRHTGDGPVQSSLSPSGPVQPGSPVAASRSTRPLVIFGDALHNFLDGVIIAVTFLVDLRLGFITSLAVIAHEIPQEIGDFGILLSSGMRRRRIIGWNVVGALAATVGAGIGIAAHDAFETLEAPLLAFAAGNFIYIALADLVPTIQHERRLGQSLTHLILLVAGIVVIWQVGIAFPHAE